MKNVLLMLLLIVAFETVGMGQSSQSQPQLTPSQFRFFNHLFKNIADPDEDPTHGQDPSVFQRREQTDVTRYGLNATEAAILLAAAQRYYAFASQANQAVIAIAGGKTDLSESDRAALANIEQQRTTLITQLGTALLTQVTPQTAERFAYMTAKDMQQ